MNDKIKTNITFNTNINAPYTNNNIEKINTQIKTETIDLETNEDFYNSVLETGKITFEDLDINRIAPTEEEAYKGNYSKIPLTDYKMAKLSYQLKNNGLITILDNGITIGYTDIYGIPNLKKEMEKNNFYSDFMNHLTHTNTNKSLEEITNNYNKDNNETPLKTIKIPEYINQTGYTSTCYESDGWHFGGSKKPTKISNSSEQKKIHNIWNEQGSNYNNGIATLNIDGKERYLVAVSQEIGKVGDLLNVNLKDGTTIHCVIADSKDRNDQNYSEYGHTYGTKTNILEFEVLTDKFNEVGQENPGSEKWKLDWDSSSPVNTIDNYGSILETKL